MTTKEFIAELRRRNPYTRRLSKSAWRYCCEEAEKLLEERGMPVELPNQSIEEEKVQ